MQLRASALLGTDLVALAIWPDDDPETGTGIDPETGTGIDLRAGRDSAGGRGDGLPVEARCVDAALAAALEDLVERAGPGGGQSRPDEGRQERAARGLLRWLVARAQRHQQG